MICRNIIKTIVVASIFVSALIEANGQHAPIVINEDNSVTITFIAPEATEVKVQGNFLESGSLLPMVSKDGKAKMRLDDKGVWTFKSTPLESELYWYNFIVDDSVRYDTRNQNVVRDISTINNYFIIPGDLADDYVDNTEVHGALEYIWYPSEIGDMKQRRMAVYTPYGYAEKQDSYPVLYLLHGSGGDETAWADCGRLVQIMDNLIAQGRCVPMIVVMPNGNVDLAAAPGDDPNNPDAKPSANNITSMFGTIENAFVPEIVNYIDKNYRTIADKRHRAIAGLSLGGLHTLYTSLNNPDVFDYVGLFSAQTTNALNDSSIGGIKQLSDEWKKLKDFLPIINGTKFDRAVSGLIMPQYENVEVYKDLDGKLKNFFKAEPQLFYIAVGMDDFTKKLNDDLRKKLMKNKYPFVYNETDGGHTWTNWRRYLVDYLPRLFN